jgi:hypothetical protein
MSGPSVLEYARAYGLAIDHTATDLFSHLSHFQPYVDEDDVELPDPDFSIFDDALSEPKLQLSEQHGAILLKSIHDFKPIVNWRSLLPEIHRRRKLKLEEPILPRDHDSDLQHMYQRASTFREEQLLETCPLPSPISHDSGSDEWHAIDAAQAMQDVQAEIANEKCCATRDTLIYLSNTLRQEITGADKAHAIAQTLPCRQVRPPVTL